MTKDIFQELLNAALVTEPETSPTLVGHELLFEKILDTEGNFATFRGILFELDWSYPQEGPVRSVKDIVELDDPKAMSKWYNWLWEDDYQFAENHAAVDFGRTKRFEGKVAKILESL